MGNCKFKETCEVGNLIEKLSADFSGLFAVFIVENIEQENGIFLNFCSHFIIFSEDGDISIVFERLKLEFKVFKPILKFLYRFENLHFFPCFEGNLRHFNLKPFHI